MVCPDAATAVHPWAGAFEVQAYGQCDTNAWYCTRILSSAWLEQQKLQHVISAAVSLNAYYVITVPAWPAVVCHCSASRLTHMPCMIIMEHGVSVAYSAVHHRPDNMLHSGLSLACHAKGKWGPTAMHLRARKHPYNVNQAYYWLRILNRLVGATHDEQTRWQCILNILVGKHTIRTLCLPMTGQAKDQHIQHNLCTASPAHLTSNVPTSVTPLLIPTLANM